MPSRASTQSKRAIVQINKRKEQGHNTRYKMKYPNKPKKVSHEHFIVLINHFMH